MNEMTECNNPPCYSAKSPVFVTIRSSVSKYSFSHFMTLRYLNAIYFILNVSILSFYLYNGRFDIKISILFSHILVLFYSEQTNAFALYNTYLLTYLLTPRCTVLPEQLTGLQLVKKFPAFHGTRSSITAHNTK